jgi:hypothetical protein
MPAGRQRRTPPPECSMWGLTILSPMHIKLSTPRKLLWHYRVATPTIMPTSKELPYDDHTTGGPCPA